MNSMRAGLEAAELWMAMALQRGKEKSNVHSEFKHQILA
jgi:hypothetical protein